MFHRRSPSRSSVAMKTADSTSAELQRLQGLIAQSPHQLHLALMALQPARLIAVKVDHADRPLARLHRQHQKRAGAQALAMPW
jgi:hypothetical protein